MSYVVASVCGVGFFVMSVLLLAVWPGIVLEKQTQAMSPAHPLDLSPSERHGREIYGREGCAYCHTQQVRYLHSDMTRFGAPTLAWETRFDYPQLWGTRRIGPDLAREGSKYSDLWHVRHMQDPRSITAKSIMPAYPHLLTNDLDFGVIQKRVDVMAMLGVPYGDAVIAGNAPKLAHAQAALVADTIAKQGGPAGLQDKEIVALIAYLQRLGRDATTVAPAAAGVKAP